MAPGDLREAVREERAGNLVILAVDASGSMGAETRMEAAKGAVLGLLLDAYQRRDRVALVTFRGDGAEVALRPTGSVEVARARLTELPTGGRTPLAAGIPTALALAQHPADRPLLVLVSDGRATAGPDGIDPLVAAKEAAAEVRRRGVPAVVVDAEDGPTRLGPGRRAGRSHGRPLPHPPPAERGHGAAPRRRLKAAAAGTERRPQRRSSAIGQAPSPGPPLGQRRRVMVSTCHQSAWTRSGVTSTVT